MEKVILYPKSLSGYTERKIKEAFLLSNGWEVIREETEKHYSGGKGCLLFLIFPPLAFFGQKKYTKVTYKKTTL